MALRDEGASIRAIAAELGIPRATVGGWLRGAPALHLTVADEAAPNLEADRLAHLRKPCSMCRRDLPWSAYWAAVKCADGTMRRPQARCKECVKATRREQRQADPTRAREIDRRDRERIREDPEKAARRRELQRENSTVHRRRNGVLPWHEYVESRRAA